MQLTITTRHSLDTSFTVQMKDKPRIFLPGIPKFAQGFLSRGVKFLLLQHQISAGAAVLA